MKKPKKKKCVSCGKYFELTYSTTQRACSWQCAKQWTQEKKAKERAGLNKVRNEKVDSDRLSELMNQAREKVHNYIRYRDEGKPCISCGAKWHSRFQAGHAWSAASHNMIRYNYDAIHGQCPKCNIQLEGNYDHYRERLEKRIGTKKFAAIKVKADIARRMTYSFSRFELKEIISAALYDIKQLKNERSA